MAHVQWLLEALMAAAVSPSSRLDGVASRSIVVDGSTLQWMRIKSVWPRLRPLHDQMS